GEGPVYLGFLTVDGSGRFSGSIPLSAGQLAVGQGVSATVTDTSGNTSEFSPNATLTTLAALRPAGLNAFDPATGASLLIGNLHTMVAGRAASVDVIVLSSVGTGLHPSFTGSVSLEFLNARDNSQPVDAGGCRPSWSLVSSAGTVSFTAGDGARRTVAVTPTDAGRELRLRLRTTAADGSVITSCSNDAFAVRPDTLAITAVGNDTASTPGTSRSLIVSGAPTPTGGAVHRAGRDFSLRAAARTVSGTVASGYDGAPQLGTPVCALPATGCTTGALTFSATAASGLVSSDTVRYSEVGAVRVQLVDETFAAIDAAHTPLADRRVASAEVVIGRFVPDAYQLTQATSPELATRHGACAAPGSGFTFVGQAFQWRTAPALRVQAVNAQGNPTVNWSGALQKLAASHVTPTYAAPGAPTTLLPSSQNETITDAGSGRALVTFSGADRFEFVRSTTTPTQSFAAAPTLSVAVNDDSEASTAGNGTVSAASPLVMGTSGTIGFDQGAQFHHGRLVVQHAFGDARRPVDAVVEVQRFTDRGWLRLAEAGTCVSVPVNAWSYTAGSGALGSGQECRASGSAAITLTNGRGVLTLPKIASNLPAAMTLILNAGIGTEATGCSGATPASPSPLNLPHLLTTRAGSTALDQNPAARVVWGQPRQAWMARRELY
ncbi:MAG: DUF6701 domain-containing protein, partial [Burkholderiaceae bacterium]